MKKLRIYVDASVVGGCEDMEFSADSLALWSRFERGDHIAVFSAHTLRELEGAPEPVRDQLLRIPPLHVVILGDSEEASELAGAYLAHGVVGPGSTSDALHVALATMSHADVLVSWNFKHIVNLGRIRQFNAVNLEMGYGILEIRTPKEVLSYE
ncbi:MAG: hypothetical protein GHCLOJNM_03675 [bacterium]|nr:hypothetical protein [bacterium]